MKTSTLLKCAEEHLWNGVAGEYGVMCICQALGRAITDLDTQYKALHRARNVIMKRLNGYRTYSEWALANGYLRKHDNTTYHITQANRLNWMRKLQREFKAKGD